MPFGPQDSPAFYIATIKIIHDGWIILLNPTKDIDLSKRSIAKIFCNSKTNIDATLIYSNNITTFLHYCSYVVQVFTKYRLSFKVSKCDVFLSRIEYYGHALTADSNCPIQPKFDLIKNGLSHRMVHLFSLLLDCVHSTIIMSLDLNLTSNIFVISSVCIIINLYHYLLGRLS